MEFTKKSAQSIVQIETKTVKVVQWNFEPGSSTGWHKHKHDYIVIPLTDGQLTLRNETGKTVVNLKKGKSYFRAAGIEHDVVNTNTFDFQFVEVELK